jgi:hypothetical protein
VLSKILAASAGRCMSNNQFLLSNLLSQDFFPFPVVKAAVFEAVVLTFPCRGEFSWRSPRQS